MALHDHAHDEQPGHAGDRGHTHGVVNPSIVSTDRGLWALKWSFIGLLVTALFQVVVVVLSGSVGLLADTIHNFGDAATAVPLGIAFWLARRRPSRRFPYGLGRVEDFAGLAIIVTIVISAVVATYVSIDRLFHPQPVTHLAAVIVASVVGFLGNEGVAIFRIRVGRQIGSAALVADGHHARGRVDEPFGPLRRARSVGGIPARRPHRRLADFAAIYVLVWQSARAIVTHMLDGVEPEALDEIDHAARHVPGVEDVSDVRARWIGHRLHADVSLTVAADLSVARGHEIAREVRHQLLHHLPHLGSVTLHVDPTGAAGEAHHRIDEHAHDGLPPHTHH